MSQIVREIEDAIENAKSIAVITHFAPDTDAFTSSRVMREIIRKSQKPGPKGKKTRKRVDIFMEHDKLPQSLDFLIPQKEKETGIRYVNPQRPLKQYDLAIVLDCASKERMGIYSSVFDSAKDTFNIDHHATNTRFANKNLVLKTSSTCEALYYIFLHRQKTEVSKYILSLLYSGILTDTNNLKNNADSKTTELAVSRIKQKLGVSLANKIKANFFESNSAAKDELYSYAYNKKYRKYLADGKFCLIVLDNKAFKQSNAEIDDAEGIVDEALHRKGVVASGIILEKEKNKLTVKLRSKEGVKISELASEFKGGGHDRIAGLQYEGSIKSFVSKFIPAIEEFVKDIKVADFDYCPELFE